MSVSTWAYRRVCWRPLSAKDAAQNAYMVSCLLARHGFRLPGGPVPGPTAPRNARGGAGGGVQRRAPL